MKRLNEIITRRQKLAASYNQRLTELESIVRPYIAPRVTKMSWQAYVVQVRDGIDRDRVMDYLIRHGVACRPYFAPIHLQPLYVRQFGYEPGAFPIAERIGQRTIALPFFNRMTGAQIEYVVEHLKQGCEQARRG
jgi:perosamine synthetase